MANRAGKSKNGAPPAEQPPNGKGVEHAHNIPTREDRAALRLSHIQLIRDAMEERKKAQEAVKALRKVEKRYRNAYETDGFSLALLDEAFDREDTPGRDLQAYERERHELFEDLGQPNYVQPDLFAQMGDEETWGEAGYRAGLAGKVGTPPQECSPEFHQTWLKRWGAGQERLAWALEEKGVRSTPLARGGPTADEIARNGDEDGEERAPEREREDA